MASTAIIQTMGSAVRPPARCGRGQGQPAKKRAARTHRNGFLAHEFKPVWAYEWRSDSAEREFFGSLSRLCEHYCLLKLDIWETCFPQNIYSAWQQVSKALKSAHGELECFIMADEQHQAVLVTCQTLRLNGLYYIPVRAFWEMSTNAEMQAEAETLLHIFAYLNQQAGVPFYQQSGSFMNDQYETLETWLNDMCQEEGEEETAYRQEQLDDMYQLRQAGGHMMPMIQNPELLTNLHCVIEQHSKAISPALAAIAKGFSDLYSDYPERTIYDNIHAELLYPDAGDTISPAQYTGFYWSPYDQFANELDEMINSAFQEISIMEEPVQLIVFDSMPEAEKEQPFGYERRLYDLMDELREYLKECEHDQRN